MEEQTSSSTRVFVGKGLYTGRNHKALISEDDTRRLFVEVYTNPDHPGVRPQEGDQAVFSSMQPS